MSSEPAVLTERRDNVLVITLNRPEVRNAVNAALAEGVGAALDELDADDDLRLGILTGYVISALTRAAVNEVLSSGKNASVPWENQTTGARGTVTPLASAYTIDNTQCRDFLASYVAGGKESWLRGEACRESRGGWQVRALKPWIRS